MSGVEIDWGWVILWGFVGLLVFKMPKIKGWFSLLSNIALLPLIFVSFHALPIEVTNEIATSIVSYFTYLFTANISRNIQMDIGVTNSLIVRLMKYGIILVILILIFN